MTSTSPARISEPLQISSGHTITVTTSPRQTSTAVNITLHDTVQTETGETRTSQYTIALDADGAIALGRTLHDTLQCLYIETADGYVSVRTYIDADRVEIALGENARFRASIAVTTKSTARRLAALINDAAATAILTDTTTDTLTAADIDGVIWS